mmetsp:Transcript_26119/g.53749  ORF Transcript_26119/g.53749 Transcript_26119/m.53749 type:complete len:94 (+) Transcript_26119:478-759(+)
MLSVVLSMSIPPHHPKKMSKSSKSSERPRYGHQRSDTGFESISTPKSALLQNQPIYRYYNRILQDVEIDSILRCHFVFRFARVDARTERDPRS